MLLRRIFHPWEGGEGKVAAQYVASRLELAKRHLRADDYKAAKYQLEAALHYPSNLGEGKLAGARDNHVHFFLGEAYKGLGDLEMADSHFKQASTGSTDPASPMYYNDQPPDMIFYQGMAHLVLGAADQAHVVFGRLISYGREHLNDEVKMDYFAVSLPDFVVFDADLTQRNRIHCHYMIGLGELGAGNRDAAMQAFDTVLAMQPDHLGATIHRAWIDDRQGYPSLALENDQLQ